LAEVCDATGANEKESIREFLENYYNIRDNPSLSIRHHGEPLEPEEEPNREGQIIALFIDMDGHGVTPF
jgi:hypothetical protein